MGIQNFKILTRLLKKGCVNAVGIIDGLTKKESCMLQFQIQRLKHSRCYLHPLRLGCYSPSWVLLISNFHQTRKGMILGVPLFISTVFKPNSNNVLYFIFSFFQIPKNWGLKLDLKESKVSLFISGNPKYMDQTLISVVFNYVVYM